MYASDESKLIFISLVVAAVADAVSYIYACKLIKLEAKTSKCTMAENVLCVWGRRERERLPKVSAVYSLVHQEKLVTLVVQASPFTREHVSLNEDRLTYSALEPAAFPPTRERALCKSVKIIQTNQYTKINAPVAD